MPLGDTVSLSGSLVLASMVTTAYYVTYAVYNLYWHPLARIPGPRTWASSRLPFIKGLLRGTIVHDIEDLHRQYGPILRIGPDEVTFADPDAWIDIFQGRPGHQQFLKDPRWWSAQPGHPASLINAIQPESHARIRRTLAPAFTARALRSQEKVLHQYINLLVERLTERAQQGGSSGDEVDIVPWLHYTTFDIFGDLGFGESFNCLQHSKYHPWIALLFNSVKAASFIVAARFYPLIEFLLIRSIPPSLKKMQNDHYQQIVDKVHRRMNWELERPDIMSYVIDQKREKEMSLGEINSTFMVLTTAGSETTATALSGTLNYLVHSEDSLRRLTTEIRGSFSRSNDISLETLQGLEFLNAVINEGLRLCPPIPWMLPRRVPPGGDTVCGVWLPGGTPVSIQTYAMNREPRYFSSPDKFLPERWLSDAHHPGSPFCNDRAAAVQSFSVGPRSCMGQHLALAEMRLILAKVIWNLDLEPIEGKAVSWESMRTFLLVEKRPIPLRIKRRYV